MPRPDASDVAALADALGITLTNIELHVFTDRLGEQVNAFEAVLELRTPELRPQLRETMRDPGFRPTEADDPLNVFIRRCRVVGAETGPLAGRTIGMKDQAAVAGVPMSFGSHFMDGYVPEFDATVTTRLLDAGATIVGKTNMEDFAFGGPGIAGVGDFGRPLNPHDPAFVTGGSSSGSAAAVTARLVDIAIGGDQAGSIRIPAAWCGCLGLMPTHGLVPHTGVFGLEPTIDFVGPLTRSAEDLATVLSIVAGRDGLDPRQADVPDSLPDYHGAVGMPLDGLRIGLLEEGFGVPGGDEAVEAVVQSAVETLGRGGCDIVSASVPCHRLASLLIGPILSEGARLLWETNLGGAFARTFYPASAMTAFSRAKRSHGHELPPNLKLMLLAGAFANRRYDGRLYAKSQNARPAIVSAYRAAFDTIDVLAMPTVPVAAHRWVRPTDDLDALERTVFGGTLGQDIGLLIANTAPFNYTGFPALSIPCGEVAGMPVGLQVVAPAFREDRLIQLASAFEAQTRT